MVDGLPRARGPPGRARPAGRRPRRHRRTRSPAPSAAEYPDQRDRVAGQRALFDAVLYGDRPATPSRPPRSWPSTTSWRCADERHDRAPRRRTRPTGLRAPAPVDAGDRRAAGRRRRGGRARHRRPRPRPRSTPTTPAPTAPGRWPGCSRTRASTSRWRATPTRWSATAVDGRHPSWSSSPEQPRHQHRRPAARARPPTRTTVVVVGAGPGATDGARRPGRRQPGHAGRGPPGAAATTRSTTGSRSRSTARRSTPTASCFDGEGGAVVAEPRRRAGALRRRPGAHQRPDPARRQRGGRAAAARPGRAAGLVRPLARRPRR